MRHSRRWATLHADEGSAAVEFVTAGVLLLVPLVYLVVALAAIQGAALAAEGAARQAARVYVQASDQAGGRQAAERAVAFALADFGVPADRAEVAIACSPLPEQCLTRSGTVSVHVSVPAPLPLVPSLAHLDQRLSVPVEASAVRKVSRLWGAG